MLLILTPSNIQTMFRVLCRCCGKPSTKWCIIIFDCFFKSPLYAIATSTIRLENLPNDLLFQIDFGLNIWNNKQGLCAWVSALLNVMKPLERGFVYRFEFGLENLQWKHGTVHLQHFLFLSIVSLLLSKILCRFSFFFILISSLHRKITKFLIFIFPPSPRVCDETKLQSHTRWWHWHQATHSIVVEAFYSIHFHERNRIWLCSSSIKNCFINYASNFEYFCEAYDARLFFCCISHFSSAQQSVFSSVESKWQKKTRWNFWLYYN